MAESFIDKDPSLETCWRSIIFLGRNVASYKFALAKSLLEIQNKGFKLGYYWGEINEKIS